MAPPAAQQKQNAKMADRDERAEKNPPVARNVIDGIPDRAARRPAWKYALLAAAFALWVATLVGLFLWARP